MLNGTAGTGINVTTTNLSTIGNLNLSLGFFAEYLIVGGGGGGAGRDSGGGGGGGGFLSNMGVSGLQLNSTNYAVNVGVGGAGSPNVDGGTGTGSKGGDSTFAGLTAFGGAGGGNYNVTGQGGPNVGSAGGSGRISTTNAVTSSGQGNNGGRGSGGGNSTVDTGGGGGGAGAVGAAGTTSKAGNGGAGIATTFTGSTLYFGGGGGGAGHRDSTLGANAVGAGGLGGGGSAGVSSGSNGTNGVANTGGGGGAARGLSTTGGSGGSGIVMVRYQGAPVATGGTVTAGTNTALGYTIHTFTTTGASSLNLSGVNMNQHLVATLDGNVSGSGNLNYAGPGRLSLAGTNNYTGTTTVSAGTLAINGNSGAATNTVTVSSGAVLAGSGTVGGSTMIQSGATHAPGNSPGLQTFNNGLTYENGSTFEWELIDNTIDPAFRGGYYDAVNVSAGTLSIGSAVASTLVFNNASQVRWSNAFWDSNQSWLVFQNAVLPSFGNTAVFESINLTPDSMGLTLSSVRTNASFTWNQQGNDVYLTYTVPEPSTYALLALAAAGLGVHLIRRRK